MGQGENDVQKEVDVKMTAEQIQSESVQRAKCVGKAAHLQQLEPVLSLINITTTFFLGDYCDDPRGEGFRGARQPTHHLCRRGGAAKGNSLQLRVGGNFQQRAEEEHLIAGVKV